MNSAWWHNGHLLVFKIRYPSSALQTEQQLCSLAELKQALEAELAGAFLDFFSAGSGAGAIQSAHQWWN